MGHTCCLGISIEYLHCTKQLDCMHRDVYIKGFKHRVSESFSIRCHLMNKIWPFELLVVGAVTLGSDKNAVCCVVKEINEREGGATVEAENDQHVDHDRRRYAPLGKEVLQRS